jgi:hypothetical protein
VQQHRGGQQGVQRRAPAPGERQHGDARCGGGVLPASCVWHGLLGDLRTAAVGRARSSPVGRQGSSTGSSSRQPETHTACTQRFSTIFWECRISYSRLKHKALVAY